MSRPLLLLVDDSREMGLIVASLCRRAAWDLTACLDAEAAWQALPQRRPDLVLLDVNLPGPSGLDWLRRVRAAPEFADVTVALYTHWGLPADVAAGLDAGVDFVFDKDLASRPGDWMHRLAEVRQAGRMGKARSTWPEDDSRHKMEEGGPSVPSPRAWADAFRQAFRHPSLRRVTREVTPAVLRRALNQAFAPRILPPDLDAWVTSDGPDPERLPPSFALTSPVDLAVCLAEQIRRLLGNEAGDAFCGALTAALPGAQEYLSRL
jgi:CheY-like chemotaxis protein